MKQFRFQLRNSQVLHLSGHFSQVVREKSLMWRAFASFFQEQKHCLTVHAFVLMDTHFHLLGSFYSITQSEFESLFLENSHFENTKGLQWKTVDSFKQYRSVYRYIYRNPLEAGICHFVEKYPFSTLRSQLGHHTYPRINVVDEMNLIHNPRAQLTWLNENHVDSVI